jgi:hypothetical protein
MRLVRYVHNRVRSSVCVLFAVVFSPTLNATLVMDPVFNRVAGVGQADNNFPLYDPAFGFNTDEPGEIESYVAGDPPDPILDDFHIWNNTRYNITGFTLRIIGTGTNTTDPGTIVRGPVDAVWGDVNGDGRIGVSDIFTSFTVSADGKELRVENGLIAPGGRFTDIHLARSDHPQLAGVDSFFSGNAVPEPGTSAAGVAVILIVAWRFLRGHERAIQRGSAKTR